MKLLESLRFMISAIIAVVGVCILNLLAPGWDRVEGEPEDD